MSRSASSGFLMPKKICSAKISQHELSHPRVKWKRTTHRRPEHVERKLPPVQLECRVGEGAHRRPRKRSVVLVDDEVTRPTHREVQDGPGGREGPRGRHRGRAVQGRVPSLDGAVRAGSVDEAEDERESDLQT